MFNLLSYFNLSDSVVSSLTLASQNLIMSSQIGFFVVNSTITFQNIRFEDSYMYIPNQKVIWFVPAKLETKTFTFTNVDIKCTATILSCSDPISFFAENINIIDYTNLESGFNFPTQCNYNGATTVGEISIDTMNFLKESTDIGLYRIGSLIDISSPFNISITNSNFVLQNSIEETFNVIQIRDSGVCTPDDNITQNIIFANNTLTLDNETQDVFNNMVISFSNANKRNKNIVVSNNTFYNIIGSTYSIAEIDYYSQGIITLINNTFKNCSTTQDVLVVNANESIEIDNLSFNTCDTTSLGLISIGTATNININNFTVMKTTRSQSLTSTSFINLSTASGGSLSLNGLLFSENTSTVGSLSIQNCVFNNEVVASSLSYITIQKGYELLFSNITFSNIQLDSLSTDRTLLINFMDVEIDIAGSILIDSINISNSSLSFINIGSIYGSSNSLKNIQLQNLNIINCNFTSRNDFISFGPIQTTAQLNFTMNNIVFENLTFSNYANIIHIKVQTAIPFMIENCSFTNIYGGSILLQPASTSTGINKVALNMQNVTVSDNDFATSTLFVLNSFCTLNVTNCTMRRNSAYFYGSIASILGDNSEAYFSSCNFVNNNGVNGGLFYVAANSAISLTNCVLFSNFAINAAIAYIENLGSINIEGCDISYNMAMQTGMIQIVDTINPISIVSSSIYSNTIVSHNTTIYDIENTNVCINLCFASDGYISYLLNNEQILAGTVTYTLFDITSGPLSISNSSFTDMDSMSILNCFNGQVSISNVQIKNLKLKSSLLQCISTVITLTSCLVDNITQYLDYSVILLNIQYESEMVVINSTFQNSEIQLINSDLSALTMDGVTIYNISCAQNVIYEIENSNVTIDGCRFENNTAVYGGAVYITCGYASVCENVIENCIFSGNTALLKGGAIMYDSYVPRLGNNAFVNNSAPFRPDISDYVIRIMMFLGNGTMSEVFKVDNVCSGSQIDSSIVFAIVDNEGNIDTSDSQSDIKILPVYSNTYVKDQNTVLVSNGIANFTSSIFVDSPGKQNTNFNVYSSAINYKALKYLEPQYSAQQVLSVNFRWCEPGEYQFQNECLICAVGSYSLLWNETQCYSCPDHASCEGASISLSSGYWRMDGNSTDIIECPNADACLGGYNPNSTYPVYCADGYEGLLCNECVVTGDQKYERISDNQCSKCPDPTLNFIRIMGFGVLILIFLIIMILVNLQKKEDSNVSVLMRIITNYLQIIAAALAFNLQFSAYLFNALSSAKQIGNSSRIFLSFDCFLMSTRATEIFNNVSYLKVMCIALIPVVFIGVCVSLYCVVFLKNNEKFKRWTCVTIITVLFVLQPTLVQYCLKIFKCVNVGNGMSKVEMDIQTECWSAVHLKWVFSLSVPMLIVYVIGAPVLAFFVLFKNRKNLDKPEIIKYFLLLYQGLRHERYYWELINTFRKCTLLGLQVFVPDSYTTIKALVGVLVLFLCSLMQARLKPFKIGLISKLEHREMLATLLTLYGGLIFIQASTQLVALTITFYIIILIFNLRFLILWFYCMLTVYKSKKFIGLLALYIKRMFCLKVDPVDEDLLCYKSKLTTDGLIHTSNHNSVDMMKKTILKNNQTTQEVKELQGEMNNLKSIRQVFKENNMSSIRTPKKLLFSSSRAKDCVSIKSKRKRAAGHLVGDYTRKQGSQSNAFKTNLFAGKKKSKAKSRFKKKTKEIKDSGIDFRWEITSKDNDDQRFDYFKKDIIKVIDCNREGKDNDESMQSSQFDFPVSNVIHISRALDTPTQSVKFKENKSKEIL